MQNNLKFIYWEVGKYLVIKLQQKGIILLSKLLEIKRIIIIYRSKIYNKKLKVYHKINKILVSRIEEEEIRGKKDFIVKIKYKNIFHNKIIVNELELLQILML